MSNHVASLCQTCFFQLRQLHQVKSSLIENTTKTLVHCARVRQQPAGLLQRFVVRCQRRLPEEAADSSQYSNACCDRSQEVQSHLTGTAWT